MAVPKIKTIQERFGFADPDLKRPEHDEIIKWLDRNIEDILMTVLKLPKRPKEVTTSWEPVVRLTEEGGSLVGYIDFVATLFIRGEKEKVVFEAKIVLGTLGELFRQLRTYREGFIGGWSVRRMHFVVVCPDESESEIIEQRGFKFLKYDPATHFGLGGV